MRHKNKGFTLAELLIVVAIIGVLVAISIPIFSKQLEKARDAATLANLRNVYAEVQTEYINQAGSTSGKNYWVNGGRHIFVTYQSNGSVIIDAFVRIQSKKTSSQMQKFINESNLAYKGVMKVSNAVSPGTYELDFVYSSDGILTYVALKELSAPFKKMDKPVSAS